MSERVHCILLEKNVTVFPWRTWEQPSEIGPKAPIIVVKIPKEFGKLVQGRVFLDVNIYLCKFKHETIELEFSIRLWPTK
jgi:hypothetical protein